MENYNFFLNTNIYLYNANYIQGIPNLNESFLVRFFPDNNSIVFKDEKYQERFRIKKEELIDIYVEDQSTIDSRVSISRLLLVGIFALTWKKRETFSLSYIIFKYKNDIGLEDQMIIQSDSKDSFQYFTNVKYNLLKFWKEIEANPELMEEVRLIQKNQDDKQKVDSNNSAVGCIIAVVIVLLAIIYFKLT